VWFDVAQAAAPAATTDLAPVLERVRKDLLDLSARNPLLSTARGGRRGGVIDVVDERSAEVFDILIRKRCRMGFRARPQASEEAALDGEGPDAFAGLALPEGQDEVLAADGVAARHRDLWLQTPLSPERLQSRLLKLSYDARSLYEERGVHVLYLALGFLAWYEAPAATTPRYAPLILVPVRLERAGALERFRIEYADEELVPNICLAEKLARGFGLSLPPLPDAEDLDPAAYCAAVAQALGGEAGFAVEPDAMALGLFSFTRLLMWRDLDPASWPRGAGLADHPLLEALLGGGFRDPPDGLPDEGCLDELLPAAGILHVLDADSSQATAIEEVPAAATS
jgi:hypothetical protein